jgi:dipeptidase
MRSMLIGGIAGLGMALGLAAEPAGACTSLVATRGATQDGSVVVTYTCDGEFHPRLAYTPAADHAAGDSLAIEEGGGRIRGWVRQVPHTYAVIGLMNERQVAIGETTFEGRAELVNPDGLLHYWDLMRLALQRAVTAREAIDVMSGLAQEYGYRSSGESFSIGDPREAWIMEMIGPGPGGTGAHWVALRVPDGCIAAYANQSRIGELPPPDPATCRFSPNVVDFAAARGYYDPAAGRPFRFCDAYAPATPVSLRHTEGRVWSVFRRAAPSQSLSPEFQRGSPGTAPHPLWIRPDRPLAVADVFALMRDHYEGTAYDLTRGIDAGPYGSPHRWRPLDWQVDSVDYTWERPISTQQTAYSFVSQSRSWLPDPIGGLFWYGLDDTYTTCYAPLYCGIDAVPPAYARGELGHFTWDSAWWLFNLVSNFADLRFALMAPEILAVQRDLEGTFLALQPHVEKTAVELARSDPALLTRYLTDYSLMHAEQVVARWRILAERLITRYNDGYVQDDQGEPRDVGYPDSWLREVIRARPEAFLPPTGVVTTD